MSNLHARNMGFLRRPSRSVRSSRERPFALPGDIAAGDFIEVGMLGAYGCAMRTQFNGFGAERTEIVEDEPMATLYGGRVARPNVMTL